MKAYLGNTYEQESGTLRTEDSEEGLKRMDCSEFVSRYLQKVTGEEKVPTYTTASMIDFYGASNDLFEHVKDSDEEDHKDIRPGDIFLWRKENDGGHTGVVISYNKDNDQVTVIEAIGNTGSAQENLSKDIEDYCKGCVRISIYSRTGKALYNHTGWYGYFRPKISTK